MNKIADALTFARLLIAVLFWLPLIALDQPAQSWSLLVLFCIAAVTDFLDGRAARRWGSSRLGALIDPVADKALLASALLVIAGTLQWPAPILVLAIPLLVREFLVSGLREAVALEGRRIASSAMAKLKTTVTFVSLALFFGHDAFVQSATPSVPSWLSLLWWLAFVSLCLATVLSVWSALPYWRDAMRERQ
ncbi:MAG: CDP-alcohol phosphatidyltransferase family protein [Pseudomonadota bacterium]